MSQIAVEEVPGGYCIHDLQKGFVAASDPNLFVGDQSNAKTFTDSRELFEFCFGHAMNIADGPKEILDDWGKFLDE